MKKKLFLLFIFLFVIILENYAQKLILNKAVFKDTLYAFTSRIDDSFPFTDKVKCPVFLNAPSISSLEIYKNKTLNRTDLYNNIKCMYIYAHKKFYINENFGNFQNLQSLYLEKNHIFNKNIKGLNSLIFYYGQVNIPNFIFESNNLQHLGINKLRPKNLKDEISNLDNLKLLYLSTKNSLFSKPNINENIYQLTNLEYLIIFTKWNKEINLSDSVQNLTKLKVLIMDIDLAENIDKISTLKNLKTLGVKSCNLEDFSQLSKLSFIEEIYIRNISDENLEEMKKALPETKITKGKLTKYVI